MDNGNITENTTFCMAGCVNFVVSGVEGLVEEDTGADIPESTA
jgi:hypothetical protein